MTAACARRRAGTAPRAVLAEMAAALANMLEAVLAAGPVPRRPGRAAGRAAGGRR